MHRPLETLHMATSGFQNWYYFLVWLLSFLIISVCYIFARCHTCYICYILFIFVIINYYYSYYYHFYCWKCDTPILMWRTYCRRKVDCRSYTLLPNACNGRSHILISGHWSDSSWNRFYSNILGRRHFAFLSNNSYYPRSLN